MLDFEELDFQDTPIGELSLRRRAEPRLGGRVIYEVKLGGDYLMSSLFTVGETALATIGLAELSDRTLDVVVGGLGLGHTASAALDHENVNSLIVVEAFGRVIEWQRQHLVPLGEKLSGDSRCRFLCGDFFALAADSVVGFDHDTPGRQFDAILVDIDHSPEALLIDGDTRPFYSAEGQRAVRRHLKPGGVFALWSDDPSDEQYLTALNAAYDTVNTHTVEFANPYTQAMSSCTIYVAR